MKDSSHKTSHCFPGRVYTPERTRLNVALISRCQAWSLSHMRHTNDRQPGAYRTLNKRGHIPCVFPHGDTSCSRGRVGYWKSTGDWPRKTLPLPKALSALFVFFFLLLSRCLSFSLSPFSLSSPFNPSMPPAPLPPLFSTLSLDLWMLGLKLWCNIYSVVVELTVAVMQR